MRSSFENHSPLNYEETANKVVELEALIGKTVTTAAMHEYCGDLVQLAVLDFGKEVLNERFSQFFSIEPLLL